MKSNEQDVAAVVVEYLDALGADVYQEVEVSGGVADIVAVIRKEAWIIEVKTSLSLALLCQARDRRRVATRVIVAAPYTRNARDVGALCAEIGIGLWIVGFGIGWERHVEERIEPKRWNTRPKTLLASLCPEHKTHAKAGAIGAGGRWTPFRQTCEELARVVRLEPGITVKAAVAEIKHHYRSKSSAASSLVHWIEAGKVDGVRVDRSGGVLALQPVTP